MLFAKKPVMPGSPNFDSSLTSILGTYCVYLIYEFLFESFAKSNSAYFCSLGPPLKSLENGNLRIFQKKINIENFSVDALLSNRIKSKIHRLCYCYNQSYQGNSVCLVLVYIVSRFAKSAICKLKILTFV